MPQQSEAKDLTKLTEVPAGWPLATVIDAFVYLAAYIPGQAREAVSFRLVELWASQPEEAQGLARAVPGALREGDQRQGDEAGEALRGAAPARGGRVGEVLGRLSLLRGGAPSRRALPSSGAGAAGGLVPAADRRPRSLPGARGAARGGGGPVDGAEAAKARGGDRRAPAPGSGAPEVAAGEPRAQQSPGCGRGGGVRQGCGAPNCEERERNSHGSRGVSRGRDAEGAPAFAGGA